MRTVIFIHAALVLIAGGLALTADASSVEQAMIITSMVVSTGVSLLAQSTLSAQEGCTDAE